MRLILILCIFAGGVCFTASCTPDGGEIARDFLDGLQGGNCDEICQQARETLREWASGTYYEDEEVNCSDPILSRVEPLPSGNYPEDLITPEGYYSRCPSGKEFYHADGTITAILTDTSTEGYFQIERVWEACGTGSRPPEITGSWVVTDNQLCIRFNNFPGFVVCGPYTQMDQGSTIELKYIQYGEVMQTLEIQQENCYLEQE